MRSGTLIGLALVVLGILALVYQGIGYTKHGAQSVESAHHATADEHKTIALPPTSAPLRSSEGL
jgi:hypothetical protein